jgi:hypothetical protein
VARGEKSLVRVLIATQCGLKVLRRKESEKKGVKPETESEGDSKTDRA